MIIHKGLIAFFLTSFLSVSIFFTIQANKLCDAIMDTDIEIIFDRWDGDLEKLEKRTPPKLTAAILQSMKQIKYNLTQPDENGLTPLHCAAKAGNYYIGYFLIKEFGISCDIDVHRGLRPLHFAAMHGHSLFAKMLLAVGANVDVISRTGIRPIHLACSSIFPKMVALLLQHGASATEPNIIEQQTPLHCATQAYGRRMFLQEKKVCGELFLAMLKGLFQDDILTIVTLLLTHDASTDAVDTFGKKPQFYAKRNGLTRVADLVCPTGFKSIPQQEAPDVSTRLVIEKTPPPASTPLQFTLVKPTPYRATPSKSPMATIIEGIEKLLEDE